MDAPMPRDIDLILLIYEGDKPDEIERLLGYAENHQRVRGCGVRPVFLLDAADPRLRDLATSRSSSLFLSPWGEGMLRMHLRQTEAPTELDAPAIRARLLRATGGIPDYIVAAVQRLRDAPERDLALAEIDDLFASPQVLDDPDLKRKLEPLTTTESPEEYAMLDEDVRSSLGVRSRDPCPGPAGDGAGGPLVAAERHLRAFRPARLPAKQDRITLGRARRY